MNFINIEVKLTSGVAVLFLGVLSLVFYSFLSIWTSMCFCLTGVMLFVAFVIIPNLTKSKAREIIITHSRDPLAYFRDDLIQLQNNANQTIFALYKLAVLFGGIGLVVFVIPRLVS
jgi:hypothetical protein